MDSPDLLASAPAGLRTDVKLSGFTHPSQKNEAAFHYAVNEVTVAAQRLLDALETNAPPRDREVEAEKARERGRKRYAREQA